MAGMILFGIAFSFLHPSLFILTILPLDTIGALLRNTRASPREGADKQNACLDSDQSVLPSLHTWTHPLDCINDCIGPVRHWTAFCLLALLHIPRRCIGPVVTPAMTSNGAMRTPSTAAFTRCSPLRCVIHLALSARPRSLQVSRRS